MPKKLTLEEFVSKCRQKHGDDYGYSLIKEYNGQDAYYTFRCNQCGRTFPQRGSNHIQGRGCPFCRDKKISKAKIGVPNLKKRKKLFGVGENDLGECAEKTVSYKKWASMLRRCYEKKYNITNETYNDCYVCDEWKLFSNFKRWFDDPVNGYRDGYHLDKDLLFKGNKMYSPETCCFLPHEINQTLARKGKDKKDELPRGVYKHDNHYEVVMSKFGKTTYIGSAPTVETAFSLYKNERENYIHTLAENYNKDNRITQKVYNALNSYTISINEKL